MSTYSLDADIVTKLLKKHPGNRHVVDRFRQEVSRNSRFILCPVVFYEVRRELSAPDKREPKASVWREPVMRASSAGTR